LPPREPEPGGDRGIETIFFIPSSLGGVPLFGEPVKSSAARLDARNRVAKRSGGGWAQAGAGRPSRQAERRKNAGVYMIVRFMTLPGLPERMATISESDLFLRFTAQVVQAIVSRPAQLM